MATSEKYSHPFDPTHQLVEVVSPNAGIVLSSEGDSSNLTRNTRVVSDRIVFVDNIADIVQKQEFVELVKQFAKRGPIIDVRFLRRTKGGSFAFIEFQVEEDGRDAIEDMNNNEYDNPTGKMLDLKATKAENPTETVSNKNLYVRGIPKYWTNEDLMERFQGFGSISHVRTLRKPGNEDENTGVGFVHFFAAVDAAKAIEGVDEQPVDMEDESLGVLEVKFARAKNPRQRNNNRRRGNRRGYGDYGDNTGRAMPNWNFGRQGGRNMRGNGRGMRGNRGQGWNMYPPNEEMWAKMVEVMQNMSLWQQNPYGQFNPQNYQYNYNPRNNSDNNAQNF